MKYNELGRTGLEVSELCLGSMTWGTQNTEAEGHQQIDLAIDNGINFIDTAEMYPTTPLSKETQGDTERIIGTWIANSAKRDKVIVATKVTGSGYANVRDGIPMSPDTITSAIEGSLKRLQTDYIDLYQLHWPNRGSYHFRQSWTFDATNQDTAETLAHIESVLETLDDLVNEGKIRHIGLSNESAWGAAQFLRIAVEKSLPRIASIQNEYSLLCRAYDLDMAELSHHEEVGLLAYSPLAAGMLTGKYIGGAVPEGSRGEIRPGLFGRVNPTSEAAVETYVGVAKKHGLDPTQMALAFCRSRPFMTSVIFGATSIAQLENSLQSAELDLSEEVMSDIGGVYRNFPIPY